MSALFDIISHVLTFIGNSYFSLIFGGVVCLGMFLMILKLVGVRS